MKASKVKVHVPPGESAAVEGKLFVYVYDMFKKEFYGGDEFPEIEKAATFKRREQERFYLEQDADPGMFDLPFVSSDPKLLENIASDDAYRGQLMKSLDHAARARAKRR